MTDAEREKAQIRLYIRSRFRGLDPDWGAEWSLKATQRLMSMPEYAGARRVGCYVSFGREVATEPVIRECWQAGRRVSVPRYDASRNAYDLVAIESATALVPGANGIREPAGGPVTPVSELDLMIVPGLAFDPMGGRVGRGRGYYDRILGGGSGAARRPYTVGVAFDFQVVERVPMEPTDIFMDAVVTEERIMRRNDGVPGDARGAASRETPDRRGTASCQH